MNLNLIKNLIYVVYPSGLGGEFLSYIASQTIKNCNKNTTCAIPNLNGAMTTLCPFRSFADITLTEDIVNKGYFDTNKNVNYNNSFVCRDHPTDRLYNFLLQNYPNVKLIILMPEEYDIYFATINIKKVDEEIESTKENLDCFLNYNYKELLCNELTTKNWNHDTTESLIDYKPYYQKLLNVFYKEKQWWKSELWGLVSSVLNNYDFQHNPNHEEIILQRANAYKNDIKNLQKYIDNFDCLVIKGTTYKNNSDDFFNILKNKFNVVENKVVKTEFLNWIEHNNKLAGIN